MKIWIRMTLIAALSLGFVMTEAVVTQATVHAGNKEKKETQKAKKAKS